MNEFALAMFSNVHMCGKNSHIIFQSPYCLTNFMMLIGRQGNSHNSDTMMFNLVKTFFTTKEGKKHKFYGPDARTQGAET